MSKKITHNWITITEMGITFYSQNNHALKYETPCKEPYTIIEICNDGAETFMMVPRMDRVEIKFLKPYYN